MVIGVFLIGVVVLAYRWPLVGLMLVQLRFIQWLMEVRAMAILCQIPGCTKPAALHLRVCKSHLDSEAVGMRPKYMQQTHPCPIPGCQQQTAYSKLMCWEHWGMTPAAQRKAVWASWNEGQPLPSHTSDCMNAIDAVKGVIVRKKN